MKPAIFIKHSPAPFHMLKIDPKHTQNIEYYALGTSI